jgi:hypothetical protein
MLCGYYLEESSPLLKVRAVKPKRMTFYGRFFLVQLSSMSNIAQWRIVSKMRRVRHASTEVCIIQGMSCHAMPCHAMQCHIPQPHVPPGIHSLVRVRSCQVPACSSMVSWVLHGKGEEHTTRREHVNSYLYLLSLFIYMPSPTSPICCAPVAATLCIYCEDTVGFCNCLLRSEQQQRRETSAAGTVLVVGRGNELSNISSELLHAPKVVCRRYTPQPLSCTYPFTTKRLILVFFCRNSKVLTSFLHQSFDGCASVKRQREHSLR